MCRQSDTSKKRITLMGLIAIKHHFHQIEHDKIRGPLFTIGSPDLVVFIKMFYRKAIISQYLKNYNIFLYSGGSFPLPPFLRCIRF